jgi:hypothetical protein
MAQGIIFAYSYNKFHATLTTRAQNTISAPTCVPETRFCCLKICGWDSGQPFVKSPGSFNTRPPCTYMKGKFPTPVNCLSGKFPGVSRGGGWLLQELTHALVIHLTSVFKVQFLTLNRTVSFSSQNIKRRSQTYKLCVYKLANCDLRRLLFPCRNSL